MQCSVQTDEAIGLFKRSYEGCTEKSQIFYKSHKYSICYPCQQGLDYWKSSFLLNFLHNVLWAGAAVVFDGLLCIFLVRMSDALGTSLWPLHTAPTQWPPRGDAIHSKLMTSKRQDTFKMVANKYTYISAQLSVHWAFSIGHPVMWHWLLSFKQFDEIS